MSRHCTRCSQQHENWPANDGPGQLCTDCWEAQSSREWWRVCAAIDEAGLMVWPGGVQP